MQEAPIVKTYPMNDSYVEVIVTSMDMLHDLDMTAAYAEVELLQNRQYRGIVCIAAKDFVVAQQPHPIRVRYDHIQWLAPHTPSYASRITSYP